MQPVGSQARLRDGSRIPVLRFGHPRALNDNPAMNFQAAAAPASAREHTGGARCVMVLGTTSGAGKSWIATALCRWYARQGLKVAPYKAQNMSNNARVVEGGEIGSAQYFQARGARGPRCA